MVRKIVRNRYESLRSVTRAESVADSRYKSLQVGTRAEIAAGVVTCRHTSLRAMRLRRKVVQVVHRYKSLPAAAKPVRAYHMHQRKGVPGSVFAERRAAHPAFALSTGV